MAVGSLEPGYRHVFRLRDEETIVCDPRLAKRTLDRRSDDAPVEQVWELTLPSGLIRRVWPGELLRWEQEEVL